MRRSIAAALGVALSFFVAGGCGTRGGEEFAARAVDAGKVAATEVDQAKLEAHVAAIYAGRQKEAPFLATTVPGDEGTPRPHVHLSSTAYMLQAFTDLGYTPVVEKGDGVTFDLATIYVDIPGTNPGLVLMTGHHDAWFQSGADDNATALATLLEAARIFKGAKPKQTIRIIAFDGEEFGLVGSAFYVNGHRGDKVSAMVNMDCLGYASHEKGSQTFPTGFDIGDIGHYDTGDFIALFANEPARADLSRVLSLSNVLPRPIEALGVVAPGDGYVAGTSAFLRSDHAWFWRDRVRAIFFTDTADFRNSNYHTPRDTPETLDYGFLAAVASLAIGSVAAFAESD